MQYCIFNPATGSRGSATNSNCAPRFMLHPHPNPLPPAGEGARKIVRGLEKACCLHSLSRWRERVGVRVDLYPLMNPGRA